ncbi:hypothetical protein NL108_011557 [Boleophthalmus pectinirostris]|uniref:uncharacterized protein LOC110167665 isoform X2 n=1 Tax=Boleophthalmus pectinirostris TaxID=150288 RepID=UPI00243205AF|nr:uncharacterized protein LOC110167665 isoform X2 [Boleophthalmus pectinirostris]KAJ0069622.1 hypothetical protein NL108_011557 [Boleophthalmus pectinirostris]
MTQEESQYVSHAEISAAKRRNHLYRQQPPQTRNRSSHCLRNCLRFCFKRRDMEQRAAAPPAEPQVDPSAEGGLKELTTAWFIHTQAPRISHNGLFPDWFHGFISRKDAEEMLKNKDLGCFLVRLSDKALGYILSYKGRDRCRHFVINQNESGEFVVFGDHVRHGTLSELVQYFKEKPVEPFGEYLTTSCCVVQNNDLYDTIHVSPKQRSVATLQAQKTKKQMRGSDLQLTQSRASNCSSQDLPPLPRRSRQFENGVDVQDNVCYAQVRRKKLKDREAKADASSRPQSLYSELDLLDSRCRSLPLLLNSGEETSYRLSVTPPRPGRDTPSPEPSHRPEPYRASPQPSPEPGARADDAGVYAEVTAPHRPAVDDTYEQLPKLPLLPQLLDNGAQYEPVGHLRLKHGTKNDKWKRIFPEVKRKW